MPAQANSFSLQLKENKEYCPKGGCVSDVDVFFEEEFVGKTNKTGFFTYEISPSKEVKFTKRYITLKKEGFEEQELYVYEDGGLCFCFFGMPLPTAPSEPSPSLTPGIFPTPPPTPTAPIEGYKSQEQRIEELETRISWLEGKIKAILDWVKDKFGDIL